MRITWDHSHRSLVANCCKGLSKAAIAGLLGIAALLSGCTTATVVRTVDLTPPNHIGFTQDEASLLDIGVTIFDANVPEDYDERVAQIILPEVRRAEANYMAYLTKNLLQSSGNWGAVRVTPRPTNAVDVIVNGKIIMATGEQLILEYRVTDATGKEWFSKRYETLASKYGYEEVGALRGVDAFQAVYKDFANDLLAYRQTLSDADISTIRSIAEMRFAQDFLPQAFGDHVQAEGSGAYRLLRLPAENDPQLKQVRKVREREYLFIDTLDEYYANFYQQMYEVYQNWRKSSYQDAIEYKELKSKSRQKIIGGTLAIAAGVSTVYASDNAYADASGVSLVGAGSALIISGIARRQEAEQVADKLRELGSDAEAELVPTTIELENKTVRLSGTVEQQYQELRTILRDSYLAELGVPTAPAEL